MTEKQKDTIEEIKALALLLSLTDSESLLSADTLKRIGDLVFDLTLEIIQA